MPNAHARGARALAPHTRARAHRQAASIPPLSSHATRLRSYLSLARRVPPIARVSAEACECEGCYCGRPDCELKVRARRRPERSRSVGSVEAHGSVE